MCIYSFNAHHSINIFGGDFADGLDNMLKETFDFVSDLDFSNTIVWCNGGIRLWGQPRNFAALNTSNQSWQIRRRGWKKQIILYIILYEDKI